MFAPIRSSPHAGGLRRHRLHGLGIGVVVAVGASLSTGVAAEAFAAPLLERPATPVGLTPLPTDTVLAEGDAVASALAEVALLQEALEQAADAGASRIHPDDPAVQALGAPADRAANPVTILGEEPDVEVAPEPQPEQAVEPAPEPAPEPESEPAATAEPEAESETVTTGSSGVPRSTWRALAGCESNGDWTIDTGNSFYGGLQFNLKSWNWAGGQRYAEYPHHATKDQQIAIAEELLDMHPGGWAAWPACSAKLGLR